MVNGYHLILLMLTWVPRKAILEMKKNQTVHTSVLRHMQIPWKPGDALSPRSCLSDVARRLTFCHMIALLYLTLPFIDYSQLVERS